MKTLLFLFCFLGLGPKVIANCTQLFFSEYLELDGNNKCLELFNPRDSAVDLDNYHLLRYSNGSSTPVSIALLGQVKAKSTFVICHTAADTLYTQHAAQRSASINHNGDDAYRLVHGVDTIDQFGSIGEDPGSAWTADSLSTANQCLIRRHNIGAGNPFPESGFPSLATEWQQADATHDLGQHDQSTCRINISFEPTRFYLLEAASDTQFLYLYIDRAPDTTIQLIIEARDSTAAFGPDLHLLDTLIHLSPNASYPAQIPLRLFANNNLSVQGRRHAYLYVEHADRGLRIAQNQLDIVLIDDDLEPGLLINEVSNGSSNKRDYIELLVAGSAGTTVDLRHWIIDDNNGAFDDGSGDGIAHGHLRFADHCQWEHVPVGSIILLYNADDTDISLAADSIDQNLDYLYVLPILGGNGNFNCIHPSTLLSAHCSTPNSSDTTYGATQALLSWSTVGLRNLGDAVQTRRPDGSLYHGFSYGDLGAAHHPNYPLFRSDVLHSSVQGSGSSFYMAHSDHNDYHHGPNWEANNDGPASPGQFNNPDNEAFIESLRSDFSIATTAGSDTCILGPMQERYFFDAQGQILLYLRNNSSSDYGSVAVSVVLDGDSGFQRSDLDGAPYFIHKQWTVQPTHSSSADYTVRLYMTEEELQAYAAYVNHETGSDFDSKTIPYQMTMVKTAGDSRPFTVSEQSDVELASPSIGFYQNATYLEHRFTSFSGFGAAVSASAPLPLTFLDFYTLTRKNESTLHWTTTSEVNTSHFLIQSSDDAQVFETIGTQSAKGLYHAINHYQFEDPHPLLQERYYRIVQVDHDGFSSLSNIIVAAPSMDTALPPFSVYPNPGVDYIHIDGLNDGDLIWLFDELGRWLGLNRVANQQIDIRHLSSGRYVLQDQQGRVISWHKH